MRAPSGPKPVGQGLTTGPQIEDLSPKSICHPRPLVGVNDWRLPPGGRRLQPSRSNGSGGIGGRPLSPGQPTGSRLFPTATSGQARLGRQRVEL